MTLRNLYISLRWIFVSCGICFTQASAEILFTDVTHTAGLSEEVYDSSTRHSLGVIWLDINNDDFPDVFITNGYNADNSQRFRPHLYLNDKNGGFSLADYLLPDLPNYDYSGASAADYDRDGDMDIYLYTGHEIFSTTQEDINPYDGPANLLLKNQFVENGNELKDALFVDVAQQAGVDLCTRGFMQRVSAVQEVVKYGCRQTKSAAFVDYDLDGWVDLLLGQIVINRTELDDRTAQLGNTNIIMRNMGDGTFDFQFNALPANGDRQRATLSIRAGHLNDDIWPDIYTGNVGGSRSFSTFDGLKDEVLINDQNGSFDLGHEYIGDDTPAAMGITFGDMNGDGRFDIYVTDFEEHILSDNPNRRGNTLYLSHATGFSPNVASVFGLLSHGVDWGTNFADFDLDGSLDLFVGAGRRQGRAVTPEEDSVIYSNLMSLNPAELSLPTYNVRGSALADYDRDGDLDLLVVNQDSNLQLFNNHSPIDINSTLTILPQASRSNLDLIGLKVVVTTHDGKILVQQILGGTSFHSQDESRLIFGVAPADVAAVKIYWPHKDSVTQTITSVSSTVLSVSEP